MQTKNCSDIIIITSLTICAWAAKGTQCSNQNRKGARDYDEKNGNYLFADYGTAVNSVNDGYACIGR